MPLPLNPNTLNDTEGIVTVEKPPKKVSQPGWMRPLKQVLAAVVIGCGAALPLLSPVEDALAFKACSWVLAVGAGLGITSSGNPPKK